MGKKVSGKLLGFLTEKWKAQGCPMCSTGQWEVQRDIFQLSEFHEGGMIIGGPLIPVVPVTCTNCGYTVLVNALVSGAMDATPGSESDNDKL